MGIVEEVACGPSHLSPQHHLSKRLMERRVLRPRLHTQIFRSWTNKTRFKLASPRNRCASANGTAIHVRRSSRQLAN
jgi:hypothetical protein